MKSLVLLLVSFQQVHAIDNGLGLTPLLGWSSVSFASVLSIHQPPTTYALGAFGPSPRPPRPPPPPPPPAPARPPPGAAAPHPRWRGWL
jgi:hypothetical protein